MKVHYLKKILFFLFIGSVGALAAQERTTYLLDKDWKFHKGDVPEAYQTDFKDRKWESVEIPHDWAIYGPFDKANDPQQLAIYQDGQTKAMDHLGRTGGLPFVGVGWYRNEFEVPENINEKAALLQFDGAMSHAQVFVNGEKVGEWPYGYNSFYFEISKFLKPGKNQLAVRLENFPESSRWYPGAGLYRNVHLILSNKTKIAHWGTFISTEEVKPDFAKLKVETKVESSDKATTLTLTTEIRDIQGNSVAHKTDTLTNYDGNLKQQFLYVDDPKLWTLDDPHLYTAVSKLYKNGELTDITENKFGIRTIEIVPNEGFYLNGEHLQFKGVNLHHDNGPLGAAINRAAVNRKVKIMKDMGVNAIRTSHNMPSSELVEACDEMGVLLMAETFDEWKIPKMRNGYNRLFEDWAEKDIVNLVHHFKNSPSIVMWSIGNEIPEQNKVDGARVGRFLQDIFHREDPTRPVTQGMNRVDESLKYNMMATMDVAGINYHTFQYQEAYQQLPQEVILGAETVSTFSSRGVYKFPVERKKMAIYEDYQASSYDVEHAAWSNTPDDNFMYSDDLPYMMGEFVWTGFDYLGEPTPYYSQWPSRSSLFGAVDLVGLPKDRFYLYRSEWNTKENTLHILPHWTWPGREGEVTPIFVYTNYPSAELFINGKSQGIVKKDTSIDLDATENEEEKNKLTRLKRYRLMWMDTKYEPGTIKAIAYDAAGNPVMEDSVRTAGSPYRLGLKVDRSELTADGKDLAFLTVSLLDKDGNLVPNDDREIHISVKGAGKFRAMGNGDATSLVPFHEPKRKTFSGQLVAIIQTLEKSGEIVVKASAKGLPSAEIKLESGR